MKILVDTCIFEHSLAFRGGWQSNGVQLWGGKIATDTGETVTKYAGKAIKASKGGNQNGALGALAAAFCKPNSGLKGYTTDALQFEK